MRFFSRDFLRFFMVYSLLENSSDFHVISHFELLRSQSWFVLGVSLWLQGLWVIIDICAISSPWSKVKNNYSLAWWDDYRYALYGSATVLVLSVGQGVWSLVDFKNLPTWTLNNISKWNYFQDYETSIKGDRVHSWWAVPVPPLQVTMMMGSWGVVKRWRNEI